MRYRAPLGRRLHVLYEALGLGKIARNDFAHRLRDGRRVHILHVDSEAQKLPDCAFDPLVNASEFAFHVRTAMSWRSALPTTILSHHEHMMRG